MTDEEFATIKARIHENWDMPDDYDVLYSDAEIVVRDDLYALLVEVERLREIARAVAEEDAPFPDGAYQCRWCGLSYMMMRDDDTHADDCPVTIARALGFPA